MVVKKEKISAEKTALHFIAQKSEGCMRDALSILDKITSFTGGKLTYANTLAPFLETMPPTGVGSNSLAITSVSQTGTSTSTCQQVFKTG